jgi:hypothetical protein
VPLYNLNNYLLLFLFKIRGLFFMHTDSGNPLPSIATAVERADQNLLLNLLKNARVSVGHLRGRFISVPGYGGQITFSKFHARVETLYQKTLKPMQNKQNQYNKNSTSNVSIMFARGRGSIFINLILLPITIPAKAIGDAVCWASTPYPEVSEEEEKRIVPVLKWRKDIDAEFKRLVELSQNKIEHLASKSCTWKIAKHWDYFLNTRNACYNTHLNDQNTLQSMVKTRKRRAAFQPSMKDLPAAAALISDTLLTYAKYRNP